MSLTLMQHPRYQVPAKYAGWLGQRLSGYELGPRKRAVNLWTPSGTQEAFELVQQAVAAGGPPRR